MTATLEWIAPACAEVLAADASVASLAAWLGLPPAAEGETLVAGPGVLPGVADIRVRPAADGGFHSLSAWFAGDEGPWLDAAEMVLGPSAELLAAVDGPYRVAFTSPEAPGLRCLVAGSTWDPPGGPRRIVEILLRRDVVGPLPS